MPFQEQEKTSFIILRRGNAFNRRRTGKSTRTLHDHYLTLSCALSSYMDFVNGIEQNLLKVALNWVRAVTVIKFSTRKTDLMSGTFSRQNSATGLKDYASQESPKGGRKLSFATLAQQVVMEQRKGSNR